MPKAVHPDVPLLTLLLAGPSRTRVTVGEDAVIVSMGVGGWVFRSKIPTSSVITVERASGPVWGWGAHGWRGRWLINGSSRGLVRLTVSPAARGRCVGVPAKVRKLTLSLERPDEFMAALAALVKPQPRAT